MIISGNDYFNISEKYAFARTLIADANDNLFNSVYDIIILKSTIEELDLLNQFWNSYSINYNIFSSPTSLLSAVRSINYHIIRNGYSSIDNYLEDQGILVYNSWAELCELAGFPISSHYIIINMSDLSEEALNELSLVQLNLLLL
jgi:hypothetical protein